MKKQPTRQVVREDRKFDQTSLRSTSHGYLVHRDYAAHFFRWGFVKRMIKRGMTVLDVGCGTDSPFVRTIGGGPGCIGSLPKKYVGVDLNKLTNVDNRKWTEYHDEIDFIKDHRQLLGHTKFDVVVNLEVIEHMTKSSGTRLLKAIKEHLHPNGRFFLSTPVFNGKAAANHIHEYTINELALSIKRAGFDVLDRFGTFASANEIKKVLTLQQLKDYRALCKFYDGDVAACFYAPMYPDHSRNNFWVLTHSN